MVDVIPFKFHKLKCSECGGGVDLTLYSDHSYISRCEKCGNVMPLNLRYRVKG